MIKFILSIFHVSRRREQFPETTYLERRIIRRVARCEFFSSLFLVSFLSNYRYVKKKKKKERPNTQNRTTAKPLEPPGRSTDRTKHLRKSKEIKVSFGTVVIHTHGNLIPSLETSGLRTRFVWLTSLRRPM